MSTSPIQNAFNQIMGPAVTAMWAQYAINSALMHDDESLRTNLANLTPTQRERVRQAAKRVAKTIKEMDSPEGQPA